MPTQQGSKQNSEQSNQQTAPPTPISIFKRRDGYKIPKRTDNSNTTTHTDIEEGEIAISDDNETTKPVVASKISNNKKTRDESPATEPRRAIELLERTDHLEQQARQLREEARDIRLRYERYKR